MRVGIYLRVSTREQTTENQRIELEQVARQRGWQIVDVYDDAGFSGAKGRDKRPGFDRLMNDATKGCLDLVAAWSVDRLGRSMPDLVSTMHELHALNVGLYLHQQALDTSTPAGRMMFQMVGVFAEFEREMIRERVRAGIDRARAGGKALGRKPVASEIEERIRELRAQKMGILKIAKAVGCGTSVVQRVIRRDACTSASM